MAKEPIWHSPAWITAMVGLVSAFFTLPDVVGSYLSKKQDIELAKQQTEAARLGNLESKQEQEFQIVQNTLAQQGTERVFVLRYLAHTLDDANAKIWAEREVVRLDDLAARREELDKAKQEFERKRREVDLEKDENTAKAIQLRQELNELKLDLDQKNAEISEIQSQAGIRDEPFKSTVYLVRKKPDYDGEGNTIAIDFGGSGVICKFDDGNLCLRTWHSEPPSEFSIKELSFGEDVADVDMFESVAVYDSSQGDKRIGYMCSKLPQNVEDEVKCVRQSP